MAFFKKASSFFKKSSASFNSNSTTTKQVDAMSAGLGLNAQSLSQLEEQEENEVSRAKDLATNKNVDESTLKEHAAQRQKERQEVRLVNRFMSRTLSGGSGSETASSRCPENRLNILGCRMVKYWRTWAVVKTIYSRGS